MSSTRRHPYGLCTMLLLALVASACGGTSGDEADQAADVGAEAATVEGEPDLDASFVYGYAITVSRLDPHLASISWDATTLFPVYDRLVHLTPSGEFIPGLAESWEFSEDGLTLTMHLRDGVTFHDGATFDAEAAKMNLDRATGIEGSSVATDLAAVEAVTVVDPLTIEISLSQPNVALIGALSDRAGIQVSPQALADGVNLDEEMVGAGPFRMVDHTPGATTTYERFDDYWDQDNLAKVAELEIRVIADDVARLNALRTDQIHATSVAARQVAEVEGIPELKLVFNPELQYNVIYQNRTRSHQGDLRVRQALKHGLDREAICETLHFGRCQVTDQPFPPGYFAHNDEIDEVLYPYDPERARELLAEAGVTDLQISMLTPAGLPLYQGLSEVIQAQWAEIGVDVSIEPNEPTQVGDLMFTQAAGDQLLATWGGRPDPAMTMVQRASSDGYANPGGHTTPLMEELIEESMSTTDEDERQEVLQAASAEMAESLLEFVLMFPEVAYVMHDDVVFEPYLTAKPEFRDVAIVR